MGSLTGPVAATGVRLSFISILRFLNGRLLWSGVMFSRLTLMDICIGNTTLVLFTLVFVTFYVQNVPL